MRIRTDRTLVAAGTNSVRYCTVALTPSGAGDATGSANGGMPEAPPADVSLIVRDSFGARTTCLSDIEVDTDVDGLHILLGDLSGRQSLTLVLATEIRARAAGASTSILVRVADRDRVVYGGPIEVSWTAVDPDVDRAQAVNRDVLLAAAAAMAARARRSILPAAGPRSFEPGDALAAVV